MTKTATTPTKTAGPVSQAPKPPAGGRPVAPLSAATVAAVANGAPAVQPAAPTRAVVMQTPDVLVTAGHKGGQRYTVWGHAVTAVLRAMGAAGMTNTQARDALHGLGVNVGGSTVGCQCGAWQSRGVPAPLTADQLARLRGLADKAAQARAAAQAAQWAQAAPAVQSAAPQAVKDTAAVVQQTTSAAGLSRKLSRKAAKVAAGK